VCLTGQAFNASNCNRKVIGARWYAGDGIDEYKSARDAHGHGTHTASTVAGSLVRDASHGAASGLAAGLARGGAPRARLAIYKACHHVGLRASCGDASVIAAIDDAIRDGVDVLSLSLGGGTEILETLDAVMAGITVVFSAGNDGPVQQSVVNVLPWVITVAAATVDRTFPTVVTLGEGEKLVVRQAFVVTVIPYFFFVSFRSLNHLQGQSLYYHNRSAASKSNDDFSSLTG
jgi:subtilisin family serine protease